MTEPTTSEDEKRRLAEAVRVACLQAALDAYEQGGLAGMCAEGRWEMATDAIRALKLEELMLPVRPNKPDQ